MSLLTDYMRKKQQLEQLNAELQTLEQDQRLKSEIEFKNKLEALMKEFDKSARDVIVALDPNGDITSRDGKNAKAASGTTRRKRKLKVYKNPHTGSVIETRGGNHKELKEWKEQYGNDTVEGWLQEG